MNRSVPCQIACFSAFLTAAASALPLINSSFEDPLQPSGGYADVDPVGWVLDEPDGGFQIAIHRGVSKTGVQSMTFNAGNTPVAARAWQSFDTVPGAAYAVSFWTAANNPNSSRLLVQIYDGDGLDGARIKSGISFRAGSFFGMTQTGFEFIALGERCTIALVDISSTTVSSDLFIDDVEVTEISAPETVGYWRFEEGDDGDLASGVGMVLDSSGQDEHGTATGDPVYRAAVDAPCLGNPGTANRRSLEFDGQDTVVAIPHSVELDVTSAFTVEFWMRSSGTGAGHDLLVDKSHGFADNTGWAFQSQPGTGVVFFALGTGAGFSGVLSNDDLFDDEWHHLAGTYDGSVVELFVDGVSQGQTTVGTYVSNTRDIRMGNTWQQSRFYAGLLDEVRISEGVRRPDQFLNARVTLEAGPLVVDTDSDGLADIVEAAMLLDPMAPDAEMGPTAVEVIDMGVRYPGIAFRRQPGGIVDPKTGLYLSNGFRFGVDLSYDTECWFSAGGDVVEDGVVDNGDGTETVTYRLAHSFDRNRRVFMRVTIEEAGLVE